MHKELINSAKRVTRTRGRLASGALAAFALVGSIGAVAAVAAPSGATQKSHRARAHASAPSLARLESELSGIISAAPQGVAVNEAGSSLMYPIWQEWAGASGLPVKLNPAPGGSGKGISEAAAGTIQIGASDAFLSSTQRTGPPALTNIPVVVSAQAFVYNLPSLGANVHLKLTATIVDKIYNGSITNWSNKAIAKVNPGVKLPNQTIIPIRRVDSSGDTFLFTSYLFYGDKTGWNHAAPYYGPQLFYAAWPSVSGELAENGNTGELTALKSNVGGITYVGVSYLSTVNADGFGVAKLQNGFGNFELPDGATIANEILGYRSFPATGALNLVYSKVKASRFGYPIVNFEYAIVNPSALSANQLAGVKAMLAWAMDPKDGASATYVNPVDFKSLPVTAIAGALGLLKKL